MDSDVNPATWRTELFTLVKGQNEVSRDAGVYGAPADLAIDLVSSPDVLIRRNGPLVEIVDQGTAEVIGSRRIEVTTAIVMNDLVGRRHFDNRSSFW